jgi:hypothetical protein
MALQLETVAVSVEHARLASIRWTAPEIVRSSGTTGGLSHIFLRLPERGGL